VADRPPRDPDATAVELTSHAFAALVGRTGFAVARRSEGHAWSLDALSITAKAGQLSLSATDAYRFAVAAAPAAMPARCDASFLVREKIIRDWLAALKDTESLKLSLGASLIVRAAGFAAWASPHPGPFPPAGALPPDGPHAVAVPTAALRSAVQTALTILPPDDPPVMLALRRGALVVSAARGATKAESSVPVPAAADSPPLAVKVDGVRLAGALEAYRDSPSVTLHYRDAPDQPVTLAVADGRTVFVPHVQRDARNPKKITKNRRAGAADDE
jgi:hypothetical protein